MEPAAGRSSWLVLLEVSTAAMQVFLDSFSATLAAVVHAALVTDGSGWQVILNLRVPGNMTLVPLPPYGPELILVERVWLYMRERVLSQRLHADYTAVLDADCKGTASSRNCCNLSHATHGCHR